MYFIRLRQNTPWLAAGMNRRRSKGAYGES